MGVFDKIKELETEQGKEIKAEPISENEEIRETSFLEYWEKTKASSQRMEDTHQRATFLIDKELLKELNKLSSNKKGFKTHFLNFVLAEAIKEEKEQQNK